MTQPERDLEDARRAGIDLTDTIQAQSIAERWRQHDAIFAYCLLRKTSPNSAPRSPTDILGAV
jgi:hypothetical protein